MDSIKTHTEQLILQAIDDVGKYLNSEYEDGIHRVNVLGEPKSFIEELNYWNSKKKVSKKVYNIIHFKKIMKEAYKFSYDVYRKKEYVRTFFSEKNNIDCYNKVYDLLDDEDSKKLFDYTVKYRCAYTFVGGEALKFYPLSIISKLSSNQLDGIIPNKIDKNLYKVKDYIIESTFDSMKGTWIEGQYHYKEKCEAKPNDVVISCGAFMGETTIWFADKVGCKGKVYSFEPTKSIFDKAKDNINRNSLSEIVKILNYGVWNENTSLSFKSSSNLKNKASNSVLESNNKTKINVKKIDTFVEEEGINKVDFIKMDIEGSELNALYGARETIVRYKPQMAICVYHLGEDIVNIPIYVNSLVPEYKFYLAQKNEYEMIMFAGL